MSKQTQMSVEPGSKMPILFGYEIHNGLGDNEEGTEKDWLKKIL